MRNMNASATNAVLSTIINWPGRGFALSNLYEYRELNDHEDNSQATSNIQRNGAILKIMTGVYLVTKKVDFSMLPAKLQFIQ
jgi:hypothetical protein